MVLNLFTGLGCNLSLNTFIVQLLRPVDCGPDVRVVLEDVARHQRPALVVHCRVHRTVHHAQDTGFLLLLKLLHSFG